MIDDRTLARAPSWWRAAIVLVIAIVLQTEVMHYVTFRNAEPSLVLLAVVWYALRSGLFASALFGLIAGLAEDVLSAQTGAAWTIATALTGLGAGSLSRRFFADSVFIFAAAVAVATVVRRTLFWFVMQAQGYPSGFMGLHLHQALWEALLNAILGAMIMFAARLYIEMRSK